MLSTLVLIFYSMEKRTITPMEVKKSQFYMVGVGLIFMLLFVTTIVLSINNDSDANEFFEDKDGIEDGFKYYIDGESAWICGYVGNDYDDFTIPSSIKGYPVVKIIDYAFINNTWLTGNLVMPDSITYIGNYAFDGCTGLTGQLALPENLNYIGYRAFAECTGFTGNLIIPNYVKDIDGSFTGCTGFTGELTIPYGVENIGNSTFKGCTGLTGDLIIPDTVLSIESSAFYNVHFTGTLKLSEGLILIGQHSFHGCSGFTGNLTIPDSVRSIGEYAFYGCSGFTGDLTIPKGVTKIEMSTFSGCSGLSGKLTISENVSDIFTSAFDGCININILYFPSNKLPSQMSFECFGFGIPGKIVNCTVVGIGKGELHIAYCNKYTKLSYGNGSEHTIRCDLDGGSGYISPFNVANGGYFEMPSYSGTKDGYEFVGWMYDGTVYKSKAYVKMGDSDMLLKAVWEPVGSSTNLPDDNSSMSSILLYVIGLVVCVSIIVTIAIFYVNKNKK